MQDKFISLSNRLPLVSDLPSIPLKPWVPPMQRRRLWFYSIQQDSILKTHSTHIQSCDFIQAYFLKLLSSLLQHWAENGYVIHCLYAASIQHIKTLPCLSFIYFSLEAKFSSSSCKVMWVFLWKSPILWYIQYHHVCIAVHLQYLTHHCLKHEFNVKYDILTHHWDIHVFLLDKHINIHFVYIYTYIE